MKVAFTGTRKLDSSDRLLICRVLSELPKDTEVITGGCVGVDALIASQARPFGLEVHTVLPANHKQVDPEWKSNCTTHEQMPEGTDYRDRNSKMVDQADKVVAFPDRDEDHPSQRRSGSWMTVRIARKANKIDERDVHVLHNS